MAAYIYPFLPSAVRAVAERCKFPFALRPVLSQRVSEAHQGNYITGSMAVVGVGGLVPKPLAAPDQTSRAGVVRRWPPNFIAM